MTTELLESPYPWFGGKARAAPEIWARLGPVNTFVDPFGGSMIVPLRCPYGPRDREVVNDLDCFVANFWRAVQWDPEAVAYWAEYPSSHIDLLARRQWLREKRAYVGWALRNDPCWHDARIAGWWCWALALSIGLSQDLDELPAEFWREYGWSAPDAAELEVARADAFLPDPPGVAVSMPAVSARRGGRGVSAQRRGLGSGKHRQAATGPRTVIIDDGARALTGRRLLPWILALAERSKRWYVTCKDWRELLSPTVTGLVRSNVNHVCGLLLDPPYGEGRQSGLYARDSLYVPDDVWEWCLSYNRAYGMAPAEHPGFRICAAGRDGDREPPSGWERLEWQRGGGMDLQRQNADQSFQEVLWFSPHCLKAPATPEYPVPTQNALL